MSVPSERQWRTSTVVMAAIVVGAIVAWVHIPVLKCQAMSFDDDMYLTSNRLVANPGWSSAERFFSEVLKPSSVPGYYQPLAMVPDARLRSGQADHNLSRSTKRTSSSMHQRRTGRRASVSTHRELGCHVLPGTFFFGLHRSLRNKYCVDRAGRRWPAAIFSLGCLIITSVVLRRTGGGSLRDICSGVAGG